MSVREEIRAFIQRELLMDPEGTPIHDDTRLLDESLVDSLGIFRLASWIEATHGIQIRDAEMIPENFGSIASLASFVEQKRGI